VVAFTSSRIRPLELTQQATPSVWTSAKQTLTRAAKVTGAFLLWYAAVLAVMGVAITLIADMLHWR
jgi:hypothetical protein